MRITVKGEHELRATAAALRKGAARLRPEVTASMKRAGQPVLREVQQNMLTMRIRGFRVPNRRPRRGEPAPRIQRFTDKLPGGKIRRRISRVTELEISTGVKDPRMRYVVRVARLGNAKNMPRLLDRGRKFRHPLPRNTRSRWAASQGEPWFREPILRRIKVIRTEVDNGLTRVVRIIEKG